MSRSKRSGTATVEYQGKRSGFNRGYTGGHGKEEKVMTHRYERRKARVSVDTMETRTEREAAKLTEEK